VFLARVPSDGCLKVCPIVGLPAALPPCAGAQPLLLVRAAALADAEREPEPEPERFGMALVRRIATAAERRKWARELAAALGDVLAPASPVGRRIALALALGRVAVVQRQLLAQEQPRGGRFANALMSIVAAFEGEPGHVMNAVAALRAAGLVSEAVDVLLLTRNACAAAALLADVGRTGEAAAITRALNGGAEKEEVLRRVAGGAFGLAMVLFAEAGDLVTPEREFRRIKAVAQSEVIVGCRSFD
jgi:hypothetical protein